jgi:hypothetical protein
MTVDTDVEHGCLKRLLRSPLLHFIIIGSALFAFDRMGDEPAPGPTIRLSASEVAAIEAEWVQRMGRPPDEATLAVLISARVDDELLLREARDVDWHRSDAIVQRRLLRNQRFLTPDPAVSDAELLDRAYAQGMDESDIVVRRRLLERMRLLLASAARIPPPTDAELEAWLAGHADDFMQPARVKVSHVYLSRDRRGASLDRDAAALATRLREEGATPEQGVRQGDAFLLSSHLPLSSEDAIARQLGAEFAAGAMGAPDAAWSDPIGSSYGRHVVWVHERAPARMPSLDEVRRAVEGDLLRDREKAALREHLTTLRERARIEVALSEAGSDRGQVFDEQ